MSDKSLGDHGNKNIVKNPLLSTAVTGLSIEDLTHNAVLLPAAPTQELITRSDHQIGTHSQTLAHPDHDFSNLLSNDPIPNPSTTILEYDQKDNPHSKASAKSEDDFDVNEYFARLQGTRYVSAPLHSHSGQTANLTPEENLEEINLNDEPAGEIQQSLTADIAQNFSQLPAVLPHVASAVFSSFSNMLNLKSREQTPDEPKPQGYQVQMQAETVPLMGVDDPVVKDLAPPPRDPPLSGPGNYRITTKKKYAQIPGLSSGETSQTIGYNPVQQAVPSYFLPTFDNNNKNITESKELSVQNVTQTDINRKEEIIVPVSTERIDMYNPQAPTIVETSSEIQPNLFCVTKGSESSFFEPKQEMHQPTQMNISQSSVIPPPPMFSMQKRDSQTSAKSVLSPSVARRIGSNHPVIKQQTMQATALTDNIFIPNFDPTPAPESSQPTKGPPLLVPALPESQYSMMTPNYQTPSSEVSQPPSNHFASSLPPPPASQIPASICQTSTEIFHTLTSSADNKLTTPDYPTPPTLAPNLSSSIPSNVSNIFTPPSVPASNIFTPTLPPGTSQTSMLPTIPSTSSIPQASSMFVPTQPLINAPPSFYNPMTSQDETKQQTVPLFSSPPTEPPKPLIEPPKLTGAVNYRMTKKRPQYYSGPIEGVGSISSNTKPILPPVETGKFQGALFTPDQVTQPKESTTATAPFDISQNVDNSSVPFDINKPIQQSPFGHFDVNRSQEQSVQPHFDTAFDLSRPINETFNSPEYYDDPKEPTGFGIIGSLKSKLSSIDINKIQSTVTTFFDPAYNDTKKDGSNTQESTLYQESNVQYQSHKNFEIFVPNVQSNTQAYGSYDYQTNQNAHYHDNACYSNQYNYYQDQSYPGYYPNPQAQPVLGQSSNAIFSPEVTLQSPPASMYSSSSAFPHESATPMTSLPSGITSADRNKDSCFTPGSNIFTPISPQESAQPLLPPTISSSLNIPSETSIFSPSQPIDNGPPIFYNPMTIKDEIQAEPAQFFTSPIAPPKSSVPASYPEVHYNTLDKQVIAQIQTNNPPLMTSQRKLNENFDVISAAPPTVIGESTPKSLADIQTYTQEVMTLAQESSAKSFFETGTVFSPVINPSVSKTIEEQVKTQFPTAIITQHEKTEGDFKPDSFTSTKYEYEISDKAEEKNSESLLETKDKRENLPKTDSLLESITKNKIPIVAVSSVPLFGLSTVLADNYKEVIEKNYEINKISSYEIAKDVETLINNNASVSFFENLGNIDQTLDEDSENVPELNICETCREVNKPEDIDERETDDLTSQLIENITSRIQLANPVEVPLSEANSTSNDNVELNTNQYQEISHITEETIETIQVQSATELLEDVDEDNINPQDYGWSTEENYNAPDLSANVPSDHDYSFKIDSDSIGFYGNNSLFFDSVPKNASDEVKAEFINQEDLLPRQINIPSAPPVEDDTKSDETGCLDVHSIELDAKKDFPIYEEFVIEPSETDDHKIEYKEREKTEEPQETDTFTNRVERFKKMEEVGHEDHKSNIFQLSSPPISMASYFDTGNFAVENHYRNSISSPSHLNIPPGFEDEFQSRLNMAIEDLKTVPDTSTQTRTTSAVTYSTAHHVVPVGFNIETNITKIVEDNTETLPDFTADLDSSLGASRDDDKLPDITKCTAKIEENVEKLQNLCSVFSPNIDSEKNEELKLPDPINFFSSGDPPVEAPETFNRLASYFASPPKTEHAKSFFELSQSQNHYRHNSGNNSIVLDHSNVMKDKYASLMKDLTSTQNIVVPTDQTIRHVNYFTVEYDTEFVKDFNRSFINKNELADIDDFNDPIESLFGKCEYCCNALSYGKNSKFRKATDGKDTESRKCDTNMDTDKDRTGQSVSVNFDGVVDGEEVNEGVSALTEGRSSSEYSPVKYHWFYRVDVEDKSIWRGFSVADSRALETAYLSPELNETTLVATDGGRYDVNVMGRLRIPVYWDDKPTNVRRCSWFYRGQTDARYVPYTEQVAEKLEEEYRHGVLRGEWHRRLMLPNGEVVVMHGPGVMVHFLHSSAADTFGTAPIFPFGKRVFRNPPNVRVSKDQPKKIDHLVLFVHGAGEYRYQKEKLVSTSRPRVVRRGHDESEIEDTEPSSIDHLLLLCHGVGSACDMRFRSVEEVVEDFRATSLQLLQSHYKNSYDKGIVSRIEVLPISWHASLHSGETGVDRRLAQITLASIPRLRHFTNDTILDVLFYTSPVFSQTILNTVCGELNRIYKLFKQRNPDFKGGVSLGGHSLGSVILYDLLCNQTPDVSTGEPKSEKTYVTGTPKNCTECPKLVFSPDALYALGSPIAIFECIRGVDSLGLNFDLPTCKNFFNIFHPYDPIAYRIEPLLNARLRDLQPFLIPHHKGRKRMHLELKDTMARVGADLKQKLMESLRTTWNKWTTQPTTTNGLPNVAEEDMEREQLAEESKEESALESELSSPEMLGRLNGGRRVDYVLQEAPLEMINEYIFAMSSHVGYWESEDTMLLMLREIYGSLGVQPDGSVPQHSMSVQRSRAPSPNEALVLNTSDYPSTSHGETQ